MDRNSRRPRRGSTSAYANAVLGLDERIDRRQKEKVGIYPDRDKEKNDWKYTGYESDAAPTTGPYSSTYSAGKTIGSGVQQGIVGDPATAGGTITGYAGAAVPVASKLMQYGARRGVSCQRFEYASEI